MKGFTKMASIFALALVVLALPAVASAQWRDRDRDDDYYGRNDNYRNGRYNRNIRGTIQNLRNRARNFERRLDRIDDRNDRNDRYGRRNRIGELEQLADRFARATNDLANDYRNERDMRDTRDEARRVLDIGSQIENVMYRSGGRRNISNEWNQISYDLRILADAYGLNYYNGGRNRNGSGDWRNRVPFPLPF
ncbi:MAG TPA: hypothetical protein VFZ23_10735 [Pyrinomonadaceae bacterium]